LQKWRFLALFAEKLVKVGAFGALFSAFLRDFRHLQYWAKNGG
jgi:hypothetical protein